MQISDDRILMMARLAKERLKSKIHDGCFELSGESFESQLILLCKVNEWVNEYHEVNKVIDDLYIPFTDDDIPF